jgi:hypothetical protein
MTVSQLLVNFGLVLLLKIFNDVMHQVMNCELQN